MLSFQLPLELMLSANLALSFVLVLPLPLSKPGVAPMQIFHDKGWPGDHNGSICHTPAADDPAPLRYEEPSHAGK